MAADPPSTEVLPWLKNLPLAPEYHPTTAEFQDPIAYIFKIEQDASRYGICKIVPPVPPQSKKTVISNLNRSLSASPRSSKFKSSPSLTTRQQQIGFCPRRNRPVQRPVWQSGEYYTFQEFEAKARSFERNYLKKFVKKNLSALEMETLFWKACVDKPFSVEYANDMPGSAFGLLKRTRDGGDALSVGETLWNMRAVSRAKGSLLRFMKEEIPGVTSPMVYIAMMFSWFAWHAEDHDLHSLNYMHMGAAKTWYGVPKDAAVAFEEVVRVQGYGGEINPLVTFAILGEKTTVMSPEVFIREGIPCCRLVQNAGEFVVTFPRAYHSGFSHGFNCAEASNIATPGWLWVAKDAAIRRASINYPPLVAHLQLLYELVLQQCSSLTKPISEPRSLRLKDRMKGQGETVVKELFVQDVRRNNELLHVLGEGCAVVLLQCRSSFLSGSQMKLRTTPRMPHDAEFDDGLWGFMSIQGGSSGGSVYKYNNDSWKSNGKMEKGSGESSSSDGRSSSGVLSCVTCGTLSFACYAIIQPREAAARYFMSTDCSFFNDWISRQENDQYKSMGKTAAKRSYQSYDVPVRQGGNQIESESRSIQIESEGRSLDVNLTNEVCNSALGLLALTYGNQSDSEDEAPEESPSLDRRWRSPEENQRGIVKEDSVNKEYSCQDAMEKPNSMFPRGSDHDSSRIHVFCLDHAVEVDKQLSPIGGVHMLLVCNPDYPKFEEEAKILIGELGIDHQWNDVKYREASQEDEERIQNAIESEEVAPGNGDWAVKLGINLYYSANLSRSPLYSKQMPYNSVIYSAFGRSPPAFSPNDNGKSASRQKKIVMAGKWCGKVWMSNQVHPLLVPRDSDEEEQEGSIHPREKLARKRSESISRARSVTVSRRTARKRKNMTEEAAVKKPKPDIGDLMKALYDSTDQKEEDGENIDSIKQLKQETHGRQHLEDDYGGPSTRLRKRVVKNQEDSEPKRIAAKQQTKSKSKKSSRPVVRIEEGDYQCDIEGCAMSFASKQELSLHKKNICPANGCGKKFFSHKYLVQHRRVHVDDRPLKCPWKGCKMTFKWAWARTEHIRVHTGARPYVCSEPGCGQTFRFVSDFSRHKRKTGHVGKKTRS